MKGVFITFEGGEGSGKTTLIAEIAKQLVLQNFSVLKTREPGGTLLGDEIRSILLHRAAPISPYAELSLFLASRAQHLEEVIRPALRAGKIVLCDRFNDSTIAYQGAARGLGFQEVSHFCSFICQGLEPQLTVYLDIDPELGLMRAKKSRSQDRIESESLSFHKKIRDAFLKIHKQNPARVRLLDASQTMAEVAKQGMDLIQNVLLSQ